MIMIIVMIMIVIMGNTAKFSTNWLVKAILRQLRHASHVIAQCFY